MTRRAGSEEGSTLVLILGYVVLAIAVIVVCVCATDLHITQKRLDALADAAALAGANAFTVSAPGGVPRAELSDHDVYTGALLIVGASDAAAAVVSADALDGLSARVVLTTAWEPPLFSPFVPGGIRLEAVATSRTAFR